MPQLQLGRTVLSDSCDEVYIIAEIGQNHQGNIAIAKQMILEAKVKIGCDCVKFQKSCLGAKFSKSALDRDYDVPHSWGRTYGEHKKHLEFSLEQYRDLRAFCDEVEIDFSSSAMDEVSLEQLDCLDVPFIKIGSGDANNFPLLEKAARLERPLIISTGMQTMKTVEHIVEIMRRANKTNFALLHCVSSYPTKPKDCSLELIKVLKNKFKDVVIGYSGHEVGIDITKAAILLGAKIVERHFTLDKRQKGSDHNCSLEPAEFQKMISDVSDFKQRGLLKSNKPITNSEIVALLKGGIQLEEALRPVLEKTVLECEQSCRMKLGKSLVSARPLKCDQKLQRDDLCIKVSYPHGIWAEEYENVIGAQLNRELKADSPIMWEYFK